ncbi:hypothetical protein ACFMPD_02385 [Sedimentitalea sp. HM32M-2]|uniref:hypothetical protein n=1 Tax=Sedimentitalea sp. HM32M-2 TaxID=3351566 RepID=UPI00362E5994
MEPLAFASSVALAVALTNLDNLALALALAVPMGGKRVLAGLALAQFLVLGTALAVAQGAGDLLAGHSGYLGLVPLSLGLYVLFRLYVAPRARPETAGARHGKSLWAMTLTFLGMSADSFGVLVPLLADSLPIYRLWGSVGAALMIGLFAALTLALTAMARPVATNRFRRAERLVPYVMILAGIYVLSDSATDLL